MNKNLFLIPIVALSLLSCKSKKEVTDEELQQGRSQNQEGRGGKNKPPRIDEIFTKMDTNKDGKISVAESQGRVKKDFAKIDTNNDGYITKEELKKAPRPNRNQPPPGGEGQDGPPPPPNGN